jgi:hypothetical protein
MISYTNTPCQAPDPGPTHPRALWLVGETQRLRRAIAAVEQQAADVENSDLQRWVGVIIIISCSLREKWAFLVVFSIFKSPFCFFDTTAKKKNL